MTMMTMRITHRVGLKRRAANLFSVFMSFAVLTSCGDNSPLTIDEYDDIPRFLEHQKIPGVSIAIIKDFKVDRVLVYGFKEADSDQPVREDTLFQAAAISQPVTAMAALKLYQDRSLDIDSNINEQLRSWVLDAGVHASRQKVSLRALLSHTSGTNVTGYEGYPQGEALPTIKQVLTNTGSSRAAGVIVNGESGVYRYSSGGYSVVQQTLMDLTAKPFETLMDEVIFSPLSMTRSTFSQPLASTQTLKASAGHDVNGSMIAGRYYNYPEMAATGLWSTPTDIAKFVIELQSAVVGDSLVGLTEETATQMLQPIHMTYGLGLDVKTRGSSVYFSQGGASKGFQVAFQAHETAGVGVVVMTNSDNGFQAVAKILNFVAIEERWPDY